jgi:hypothetical protein
VGNLKAAIIVFVVAIASSSSAQVSQGRFSGGGLYRRTFCGLAAGQHTFQTIRSGTTADPYMYVLEVRGSDFYYVGDDDDGAGNLNSRVVFTVPAGSTSCWHVIVTGYADSTWGTAAMLLDGTTFATSAFGGARWAVDWSSNISVGGGTTPPDRFDTTGNTFAGEDNIIYLIKRRPGYRAAFDDDSGANFQSRVNAITICSLSAGDGCVVVSGSYGNTSNNFDIVKQRGPEADADGDGLRASVEAHFGTSDTLADSDGDGLRDDWEILGVPSSSGLAFAESPSSLELRAEGASATVQDLFVRLDFMVDQYHSDEPSDAFGNLAAWLKRTLTDDTAYTGRRIVTHLKRELLVHKTHASLTDCWSGGPTATPPPDYTSLAYIKRQPGVFNPTGVRVYKYLVASHFKAVAGCTGANLMVAGQGEVLGNDAIYYESSSLGPVRTSPGAHMHELGHTLGLNHFIQSANGLYDPNAPRPQCTDPEDATGSRVHHSVMNLTDLISGGATFNGYLDASGVRHYGYSNGTGGCEGGPGAPSPKCGCGTVQGCDCDRNEWLNGTNGNGTGSISLSCDANGLACSS